jgi:hypothetical protein
MDGLVKGRKSGLFCGPSIVSPRQLSVPVTTGLRTIRDKFILRPSSWVPMCISVDPSVSALCAIATANGESGRKESTLTVIDCF